MQYIPIIGLEIHVQLKTKSKMFCSCDNSGENKPPNTTVCPICMGHPGVLPVPNKKAIEYAVLAALALNCKIEATKRHNNATERQKITPTPPPYSKGELEGITGVNWCSDGVEMASTKNNGAEMASIHRIRIKRVHLEEDAAKLLHTIEAGSDSGSERRSRLNVGTTPQNADSASTLTGVGEAQRFSASTYVDFNRSGTPLLEIVTEPDFRSPQEAKIFLQELRLIMRYLKISDADMEKGQLRVDANVSLLPASAISSLSSAKSRLDNTNGYYPTNSANNSCNPRGERSEPISEILYPKTEIKNLNSFKAVERALEYEIMRQTKLFEAGTPPNKQSTRGWNDIKGITEEQRAKEESHDYRYFPEPDIPPFSIDSILWHSDGVETASTLPELPAAKRERFKEEYGFTPSDARILTDDPYLADYVEKVMSELYDWLKSLPEQIEGV